MNMNNKKEMTEDSTILYGVPQVGYSACGVTPFPMCLKACANYLGQDVSYDYTMAASGSGFRLIWDTTCWNGGNVDVIFTYDHPAEIFRLGSNSLGWKYNLLGRDKKSKKEDFTKFITEQLDKGLPCIALGIIGPPEACIITGYRNNGEVLIGWNFFQDNPEFGGSVTIDASGYFVTDSWWENPDTVAVMSVGEENEQSFTAKDVIKNGISALEGRKKGKYAKGISAYDAWAKAVSDDSQFPENAIIPILTERLMCQADAMDCLLDGRHNTSKYLEHTFGPDSSHHTTAKFIIDDFNRIVGNIQKMANLLGGWERNETQMKNFAKKEIREQIVTLINDSKSADMRALENLKMLYNNM